MRIRVSSLRRIINEALVLQNSAQPESSGLLESFVRESPISSSPILLASHSSNRVMIERFDRDMSMLIKEGILDTIASAFETVKGGALKLKKKISDAALAAIKQVSDMFMNMINAAIEKVASFPKQALELCKNIIDRISSIDLRIPGFKEIVMYVCTAAAVASATGMIGNEAEARLMVPQRSGVATKSGDAAYNVNKRQPMSQETYHMVRGRIIEITRELGKVPIKHRDLDLIQKLDDYVILLDKLYNSKKDVDLSQIEGEAREIIGKAFFAVEMTYNAVYNPGAASPNEKELISEPGSSEVLKEWMKEWVSLGKNTLYNGIPVTGGRGDAYPAQQSQGVREARVAMRNAQKLLAGKI